MNLFSFFAITIANGWQPICSQIYYYYYYYYKLNALSQNHSCTGRAISRIFWMCVVSLSYPACKAYAPQCIITCGLSRFTAFSTSSLKQHDFRGKNLPNPKYVLIFSTSFDWNIILRRSERDMIVACICLRVECPSFLSDFDENWIFSKYFGTTLNIRFHENPSSGIRVVPRGQSYIYIYYGGNSRFSEFWEHF